MKKEIVISMLVILLSAISINAQILTPVQWEFSAKKISEKTYEIHCIAKIETNWHIYSKDSPEFGPTPTNIQFENNRSMILLGKAKEIGDQKTKYEKVFKLDVLFYYKRLELVQIVKFKNKVPQNINGIVTYMACKGEQCLPPTDAEFTIEL